MRRILKNNFFIAAIIFISVFLVTTIYYVKGLVFFNFLSLFGNVSIILMTMLSVIVCNSLFVLATDYLFCKHSTFKERFFYITKSMWLSQLPLLPVTLILIFLNFFVNLEISTINDIIVFCIAYLSQLVLFFSYKFITNRDWSTTIKVVASQFLLTLILSFLLKFI